MSDRRERGEGQPYWWTSQQLKIMAKILVVDAWAREGRPLHIPMSEEEALQRLLAEGHYGQPPQ